MTTRFGSHRNYRLPNELVAEIRDFASYNNISESEATRRLLCGMIFHLNARGTRSLWGSTYVLPKKDQ